MVNAMTESFIDITGEACPMTFVRVKLRLENLPPGASLRVRLGGGEPLANVTRALKDEGCQVFGPVQKDGLYELIAVKPS